MMLGCLGSRTFIMMVAVVWHLMFLFTAVSADINVVDTDTNETAAIFEDVTAAFGPAFPEDGIQGLIVYANPPDACGPVAPPPKQKAEDMAWILLIARGGNCQFADKVLAAQMASYDVAIVHNYERQEQLIQMHANANGSFVNIPSTFVGWQEGMNLKNEYNFRVKNFYINILESSGLNYKLYLWPFLIVVAVCFILVMIFVIARFAREHASRRLNRLSKKHLNKIPVRKFKKGDYYDTCAICLDEYEEGEKIRVLPCDHVYHTKCIDPWLTKNKKTCPVCKRRVMPGHDPDADSEDEDYGDGGNTERTPLLQEVPQLNPTQQAVLRARAELAAELGHTSDLGAVGGAGISDRRCSAGASAAAPERLMGASAIVDEEQDSNDRRRKSGDHSRGSGSSGRKKKSRDTKDNTPEGKEARRQERRLRKELKRERKALEEEHRQAMGKQEEEEQRQKPEETKPYVPGEWRIVTREEHIAEEQARLLAQAEKEVPWVVEVATRSDGTVTSDTEEEEEANQEGLATGQVRNDDGGYINPSYSESSESQDVFARRPPSRKSRRTRNEMNDMV